MEDATVLEEDPLTLQPLPGPEPTFEPGALGREVVLVPATTADEIPESFWEITADSLFAADETRSSDRPVLHIGYVEEIDARLLIYGSDGGERCESTLTPNGAGVGGCAYLTPYRYGVKSYGGQEGQVGDAEVEVPEGTSVVTVSVDGGPVLWQRPVAGWAIFPVMVHDSVEFDVVAYDASGQVIGRWDELG